MRTRGKFGRGPLLVELVRLFLLDAVVAGEVKALAVVGLQVGIGRRGAEAVEIVDEVVVEDDQREMRVGMFVETRPARGLQRR